MNGNNPKVFLSFGDKPKVVIKDLKKGVKYNAKFIYNDDDFVLFNMSSDASKAEKATKKKIDKSDCIEITTQGDFARGYRVYKDLSSGEVTRLKMHD